jgi:hypothetical protein
VEKRMPQIVIHLDFKQGFPTLVVRLAKRFIVRKPSLSEGNMHARFYPLSVLVTIGPDTQQFIRPCCCRRRIRGA